MVVTSMRPIWERIETGARCTGPVNAASSSAAEGLSERGAGASKVSWVCWPQCGQATTAPAPSSGNSIWFPHCKQLYLDSSSSFMWFSTLQHSAEQKRNRFRCADRPNPFVKLLCPEGDQRGDGNHRLSAPAELRRGTRSFE